MKNKVLIIIGLICVFVCSMNVTAQTLEERVRILEERVNLLITDNQNRDTAYENKLNAAKQTMTTGQQTFEVTVNDRLTAANNALTQLRTDLTTELSNNKTNLINLISDSSPVGTVIGFLGNQPANLPANWKLCDGSMVTRAEFPKLFEIMGFTGDSSVLPDLSGQFLRGINVKANVDPDGKRKSGTAQLDMFQSHKHNDSGHKHTNTAGGSVTIPNTFGEMTDCGNSCNVNGNEGNQGDRSFTVSVGVTIDIGNAIITNPVESDQGTPRIGIETRPKNVAVYWIIKVK
jgi:microcystin-dependent protein